jgi:hypothetical protein
MRTLLKLSLLAIGIGLCGSALAADQLRTKDRVMDQIRLQDPTTHTLATILTTSVPLIDKTQLRDRDQVRDPATHDGDDFPDQDRIRDRLHTQ